jgi:hypothetical protein
MKSVKNCSVMQLPPELADVDLDLADRDKALALFPTFRLASQFDHKQETLVPHNTGLYAQNIPVDPLNQLSVFPYELAEDFQYYKIDFITNKVYALIENEAELEELVVAPVNWKWFTDNRFFTSKDQDLQLTHLHDYYNICKQYPPKSVEDVAILIAMIRPRKKYLIGETWEDIKEKIWEKLPNETGYFFKKSHAFAFGLLVIVHAHLIARNLGLKDI